MVQRLLTLTLLGTFLWTTFGGSLEAGATELTSLVDYKKVCQQKKPLVILFYADWCGACKVMKEPYDKVADATSDVVMVKVNIANKNLKILQEALCVSTIPTIVTRQSGAMTEEQLMNMVTGHIRQPAQPQKAPLAPQTHKKS